MSIKNYTIYKITNNINKKVYIGQTSRSLTERKAEHISDSKKSDRPLYRSIRKYGRDKFSWDILHECSSKEELNNMEILYISRYKSSIKQFGYNLTIGGDKSLVGKYNPSSKSYKITDPYSNIFITKGLAYFCREHNLESTNMASVACGRRQHVNGWFCEHIDEKLRKKADEVRCKLKEQSKINIHKYINSYKITSPSGIITFVGKDEEHTLKSFCKEHTLQPGHMSSVAQKRFKHHKDWKCEHINEDLRIKNSVDNHTKMYSITSPSGKVIIVGRTQKNSLNNFCIKNNLFSAHMYRVAKGERKQHKGYTCEELD